MFANIKKKKLFLIVSILTLVFMISGGTYAYWYWSNIGDAKNLVIDVAGLRDSDIMYKEGDSYFVGDFQPTNSFCESINTTISFKKADRVKDYPLYATIHMDINSIGSNITASDDVYWIVTKGDNTITCDNGLSSDSVLNYGIFQGIESGDALNILENIEVTTEEQTFTIWIWIDYMGDTISSISGEIIDSNIWTEITMYNVIDTGNPPALDKGMIPVTIANDGKVTTVSASDPSWYNYNNKEWANVVLVNENATSGVAKSHSRSYYLSNLSDNVEVAEEDILAYYVWIPRYKYRISSSTATSIDIEFENSFDARNLGNATTTYYTHPAFWWDDDNDGVTDIGEMLSGIWVAKFKESGTSSQPLVLPNKQFLDSKNVGDSFSTSLMYAGGTLTGKDVNFVGNSFYGLSSRVDSHLTKNSEWGAIAYLTRSEYGINKALISNGTVGDLSGERDFANSLTGCGEVNEENNCSKIYGQLSSYPQSTTGNISGIFDMSGVWEIVMGNYNNMIIDSINMSSNFEQMPEIKYYDLYTSKSMETACNGGICYGHALSETLHFTDGDNYFFDDNYGDDTYYTPWLVRSDLFDVFSVANDVIDNWFTSGVSSRSILITR
ncbi:MAG: hypothetical protein IJE89_05650 [Bacilli bacterium]|nr:hypothetical protein [Bacilli bacterium]